MMPFQPLRRRPNTIADMVVRCSQPATATPCHGRCGSTHQRSPGPLAGRLVLLCGVAVLCDVADEPVHLGDLGVKCCPAPAYLEPGCSLCWLVSAVGQSSKPGGGVPVVTGQDPTLEAAGRTRYGACRSKKCRATSGPAGSVAKRSLIGSLIRIPRSAVASSQPGQPQAWLSGETCAVARARRSAASPCHLIGSLQQCLCRTPVQSLNTARLCAMKNVWSWLVWGSSSL